MTHEPVVTAKAFGAAIQEARERRGLSQQQLADRIGVSKTIVSHIETGRKQAAKETVDRLLEVVSEDEDRKGLSYMAAVSRLSNGHYSEDFALYVENRP